MGLVRDGALVTDEFLDASALDVLPAGGPIVVTLGQWEQRRAELMSRGGPLGIRLKSDEHPRAIVGALAHFALVALEFPKFRDGRAYTHARLLRERYGYRGEIRAVGDVLLEQLPLMRRCGFDAFDLSAADPEHAWLVSARDHSVWYQATGDGHPRALDLRRGSDFSRD